MSLSPLCPQEVKVSSAPFLLLRIPSLKLRVRGRKEAFEANLKTETELWNLMVKEMWAGRNMADQHKVKFKMKSVCDSVCVCVCVRVCVYESPACKCEGEARI